MRSALESEHVSNELNQWIDLIFGYKQRGQKAYDYNNLFQFWSYENNNIDIEDFDEERRESYITSLLECGQTPKQLFMEPHPKKRSSSAPTIISSDFFLQNPQKEFIIQINKYVRDREKLEKNNERLRRMIENEKETVQLQFQELEKKRGDELKKYQE